MCKGIPRKFQRSEKALNSEFASTSMAFYNRNEKEIFKLLIETESITKCFVDIIKLIIAQYSRGQIWECKDCEKEGHQDHGTWQNDGCINYFCFDICDECIEEKGYCEYCGYKEDSACLCCPKHGDLLGIGEFVPAGDCFFCERSSRETDDSNDTLSYW